MYRNVSSGPIHPTYNRTNASMVVVSVASLQTLLLTCESLAPSAISFGVSGDALRIGVVNNPCRVWINATLTGGPTTNTAEHYG